MYCGKSLLEKTYVLNLCCDVITLVDPCVPFADSERSCERLFGSLHCRCNSILKGCERDVCSS